jgi:hypothetical protein
MARNFPDSPMWQIWKTAIDMAAEIDNLTYRKE